MLQQRDDIVAQALVVIVQIWIRIGRPTTYAHAHAHLGDNMLHAADGAGAEIGDKLPG